MKINIKIVAILLAFFSLVILSVVLKGQKGNPLYFQHDHDTKVGGPFESTNSTSRYALTEAIVKNHSFYFNNELARFAAPDLVQYRGHYFSIFTPGISFLGIPLYFLGKLFGMPQFFTYLLNPILAILNAYLIARIAQKLGAGVYASFISGFVYLFATNSLAYALTFTQHQASVTVILLAILTLFGERTLEKNILLGMLCGAGVLFDIPNIFFLLPVVLYVFAKHFSVDEAVRRIRISFHLKISGILIGILPFVLLFMLYNRTITGSFFKLGQTIGRSNYAVKKSTITTSPAKKDFFVRSTVFNPRFQLNGLYILLTSDERGIFYFSPVLLIGILGMFVCFKSKNKETKDITVIAISIVLLDTLLYSMFGDPWGGWSFGARYMIPGIAVLSCMTGPAIEKYGKRLPFVLLFLGLFSYSMWVSTMGALTTNAIPPKQEAVALSQPIPYTYKYNLDFVHNDFSSSLFYNLFLKNKIPAESFMYWCDVLIFAGFSVLYIALIVSQNSKVRSQKFK